MRVIEYDTIRASRNPAFSKETRHLMRLRLRVAVVVGLAAAGLFAPSSGWSAEFHVAVDGTSRGDGSAAAPWDLATALSHPPAVRPGDSLHLAGGTYAGTFACRLTGEAGRPIVVRAASGARATIDCRPIGDRPALFTVDGAYIDFRDLELMCGIEKRSTDIAGSWPVDINRGGIHCKASHARFINLVVHDCLSGFGFWSDGEGGEIYGSIITHNGWQGPDRAHGHGIYVQNVRGTKRLVDNIIGDQFGYGIHAYGSKKASLRGLHVEGNILFDNGSLGVRDRAPNLLVGGDSPAGDITVVDNLMYQSGFAGTNVQLGYGVPNDDVRFERNYVAGFARVLPWRNLTVRRNTFVGETSLVELRRAAEASAAEIDWNENRYLSAEKQFAPLLAFVGPKIVANGWKEWQAKTGFDAGGSYEKTPPKGMHVVVRPNLYEPGRANVAVVNWDRVASCDVDLSHVLKAGQAYRVVNARNFYGPSVAEGTFDGTMVRLTLTPTPIAKPVGLESRETPADPHFAVFVVLPK
jgi:hypothetical protein